MHVDVRRQGIEVSAEARLRLERRLAFALGRFSNRVGRVTAHLAGMNGTSDGIDKSCRLVVHLQRGGEVVLEDRDADLYVLLDRIANRSRGAVLRDLGRRRRGRRNLAE